MMVLGKIAKGEKRKHFIFYLSLLNMGYFPCAKVKEEALLG